MMNESTQELLYCLLCLLVPCLLVLGFTVIKKKTEQRRANKLAKIADFLGWEFYESHQLPIRMAFYLDENFTIGQNVHFGWLNNTLVGKINGVDALIFDTPIFRQADVSTKRGMVNPQIYASSKKTILLLQYHNGDIPQFHLRSPELTDRFFPHDIRGKFFVVDGVDIDMLQRVFTYNAKKYYDKREGVNIEGKDQFILIYYDSFFDGYLPAKKETYLDLIQDGEQIIEVLQLHSLEEKMDLYI